MHCNLNEAFDSLITLGEQIKEQFLPREICPFIVGVLGCGEVGNGVVEALKFLPHKIITKKELCEGLPKTRDLIYIVVFKHEDLYENKKTGEFDWKLYIADPENYISKFSENYLDKLSIVINCLYWEKRFPKVITKEQLKNLFFKKTMKLLGISDISCDLNGSIEMLETYNSNCKPFSIYEPLQTISLELVDDASKDGIIYTAIPYLAASFSYDASEYFSDLLFPFLNELIRSKYPLPEDEGFKLSEELTNAILTSNGQIVNYSNSLLFSLKQQTNINPQRKKIMVDLDLNNLKLVGHLVDRKVYHRISILLLTYNLEFEVLYAEIGDEGPHLSTIYLSVSNKDHEAFEKCFKEIEELIKQEECEVKVIA